ncbi:MULTISPECIES: hypothetical protein [unclassified Streptomyces]|uniref:hypothetical protein n=1 Tax=unclassified Streptomyces TaxID=2593676 RepID=UPI0036ED2F5B
MVPVVLGGASAAPVAAAPSATPVSKSDSSAADQQPTCGDPEASAFPINTRMHGGPDTYASGGGYGIWYLDLTNTTTEPCRAIHPVLVLTDEDRKLTSDQIQLEFSDPARPDEVHRVTWETTDQDEHIGVFGGDGAEDTFEGFTVPAGRTVTVQVRMAFTSDTGPGRITVGAAIVQRQHAAGGGAGGDDGAWVGESGHYLFAVVEDDRNDESYESYESNEGYESDEAADTADTDVTADADGTKDAPDADTRKDAPDADRTKDAPDAHARKDAPDADRVKETGEATGKAPGNATGEATGKADAPRREASPGVARPDGARPSATAPATAPARTGDASRPVGPPDRTPPRNARPGLPELAATGSAPGQAALGVTVAGLLIGGGALVVRSRRPRSHRD